MINKFSLDSVRVIHLEPTTICNALCPQCERTIFQQQMGHNEIYLRQFQQLVPEKIIKNLSKLFMCGNFGDPAAAKDTLEIFKWVKSVNPTITCGINTNGGLRSVSWWAELGSIFKLPTDFVIFSIDGLEDTNHIYRIGVRWSKVMENAASYISAGGSAHWDMLVFKHNEHQVDTAQQLAKNMGFNWFRTKITKREYNVNFLSPPTSFRQPAANTNSSVIDCAAINDNSIYINAHGKVYPCCWIGSSDYVGTSGCSLGEITDEFNSTIERFNTHPRIECVKSCSVSNNITPFKNQWKSEIQLK